MALAPAICRAMRHDGARGRTRRWLGIPAVATAVAVLAGCTTHPAPAISAFDLARARQFKELTVYWAGTEVDGVPLTAADNLYDFVSAIGFAMYYGNCEGRGNLHASGCTLPLKITTVRYVPHSDASFGPLRWVHLPRLNDVPAVIYNGGDDMEIYTDRQAIDIVADSPARAVAAVNALRPFNRTPSASFPAFPKPFFTPDLSPEQIAAAAGGSTGLTGLTGATGATADIQPPPGLEPAPGT
jgi:hypothetical protein